MREGERAGMEIRGHFMNHCEFTMFYAERNGGEGEPYIAERGVFMSIAEFVPYREKGWSGQKKHNDAADEIIQKAKSI